MSPALSVVVPVRNDPKRLRACLDSLKASTDRDHELIVVDDASTDTTPEVAAGSGARVERLDQRSGPAAARNHGAQAARGEYLFFVDADVCVHPETLSLVAAAFASDPTIDALFGSYDRQPGEPNLLSQYKNLFHHFVHQQAASDASTFWSGCGAIKRSVFLELGGFDTAYDRPCIEDIELGARLRRTGRRIVVRKEVQASHLKRWTLPGILRSDFWDRAVPWTELSLREGRLPNDLNLKLSQRVAALLTYVLVAVFAVAAWRRPALLLAPIAVLAGVLALDAWSERTRRLPLLGMGVLAAAGLAAVAAAVIAFGAWALAATGLLLAVVGINARFYAFFARERHPLFVAVVLPLHLFYYCYSGVGLVVGFARHAWRVLHRADAAKDRTAAGAPPQ
jgi:glycosyltransferase involved in cell wall biosynthesis